MQPARSLLLYLAWILLAGAGIAPWLYWAAAWGAAHFTFLQSLAGYPFHRFVHRSMLVMAIIGLWPFLRALGFNSWSGVGLVKFAGQGRRLLWGVLLGFGSLAAVALLAVGTGARALQSNLSLAALLMQATSAMLTAAAVGTLEEILFRGALFGALRKAHHWVTALLVSSAVYSIVHFFVKPPAPSHVTWATGFLTLLQMCRGFGELQTLVPGFFTLLLAGMILGLAYYRTTTLYFSIGLHAGWIFWLKFYNHWTTESPATSYGWWGTAKLVDGWLAFILLGLVFLGIWFALPRQEEVADAR